MKINHQAEEDSQAFELSREAVFSIGRVSSVKGRKIEIRVSTDKNLSHLSYLGKVIKNISVGSYVKISKGFIEMVGRVEGEYMSEKKIPNYDYTQQQAQMIRTLDVSLLGYFSGEEFRQGVKEMPLIDNECYLLDKEEYNKLHQFHRKGETTINIGVLTEDPSQNIYLGTRKLFASHIGVFGNTGSGKSNTLAKIYSELFENLKGSVNFKENSKFILIDFNGEYGENSITSDKKVYKLRTDKIEGERYPIRKEQIEKIEILSVLLEATEKTQKPFLSRVIRDTYFNENFEDKMKGNIGRFVKEILSEPVNRLTMLVDFFSNLRELDTSNNNSAQMVLQKLNDYQLKYHSKSNTYYCSSGSITYYANSNLEGLYDELFGDISSLVIEENHFSDIQFRILSKYYYEIIKGYSNQEHIGPLIGRMSKKFNMLSKLLYVEDDKRFRNLDDEHQKINFEVINLKNVNIEMKKTIPLIVCKQLYEEHKEKESSEESLHIIIDEAHNILSSSSERESETWKDYRLETFEEIIKEGRKFSTFLTICSQRPYDISTTIISQLHTYFIHRLINEKDIEAIEKAVAYLDKLSFESIPVLSVGNCFVAGLASDIPIKADIALLPNEKQPQSETIDLDNLWKTP